MHAGSTYASQATLKASSAGLQYQEVASLTISLTQSGLLLFSSMYLLKPWIILMQPSTHFEVNLAAMGARNLSVKGWMAGPMVPLTFSAILALSWLSWVQYLKPRAERQGVMRNLKRDTRTVR